MKYEKKLSCLMAGVMAFVIGFASIGCIETAFSLQADMALLGWICALWAAFSVICFYFRRGGTVFLCASAILLGFLAREGTAESQLESLLFHISSFYHGGYGCGVIYWTGPDLQDISVNGGLILIGALVISVVAWVICRRKNEIPAILASVLPLSACLVVTDTIPETRWLFLLLMGLTLLLLTHPVRKKKAADGIRLTAMLLIPVFLAGTILFAATPQDSYGNQMNNMQQWLIDWFYQLPFSPGEPGPGIGPGTANSSERVDLSSVGMREDSDRTILSVVAETSQLLYLRGQSYDTYDGLSWVASDCSTGVDPYWPTQGLENAGYVRVSTKTVHNYILLPYYVAADSWEYDFVHGKYENIDLVNYAYFQKIAKPGESYMTVPVDYTSDLVQQCLRLPEQTLEQAREMLEELSIDENLSPAQKAERIGEFVRHSALYDQKTDRMPEDETDFALWFLEDSETGYCIHFATAATVLLRASGVPARYVTGYAVQVQEGFRRDVTSERAHAWVEYLDPHMGWQILEATPGEALIDPDATAPTDPPETQPTKPPETEPPETEPPETEPSETGPTEPTETEPTTEPTDPTETEPTDPTSTTDPTQETQSGQTGLIGSGGNGKALDWAKIMPVLKPILWILGAVLLLVCQSGLRIRYRKKRMYRGDANRQALARWRYAKLLKRLSGKNTPQHLLELAEKAAFSQHTLTKQELEQFDTWLRDARQLLKRKPWPLRLVYTWIFAVS